MDKTLTIFCPGKCYFVNIQYSWVLSNRDILCYNSSENRSYDYGTNIILLLIHFIKLFNIALYPVSEWVSEWMSDKILNPYAREKLIASMLYTHLLID
jgi:hypothetical protein